MILSSQAGCNLPENAIQESPAPGVTQAYQTVAARLTTAAGATATITPSPAPTDTGIVTPSLTPEPAVTVTSSPTSAPSATAICDRAGAGNPIDLTIPDDTRMQPGEEFTKKWALQNVGTCTWTKDYAVKFFSGERMGAPDAAPLGRQVNPGQTVEISIDMTAPETPGTYQGNWKLLNDSSQLFGIGPNGSAPFWVRIVVVQPPTDTPTPPTTTPSPTPTATAIVQASGVITLIPGTQLDLDSAQTNPEAGADLSFESSPDGSHMLTPLAGAVIGVSGTEQPGLAACQEAAFDAAPVVVDNLAGSYLCYRTNQGLPGWALVHNLNPDDFSLSLEIFTWSLP